MIKVIDMLKLPSLKDGYIVAGGNGIYRVIRRFEILEETYPSVVSFLREGIFYVTTFWNIADDKQSRICLIEEMIRHKCAGIGIMAGKYLHNEIDSEILKLGNNCNFPIFYIPTTVLWGDLLAEYGALSNNNNTVREQSWVDLTLGTFVDFHMKKDPGYLCRKMSEILHLPVIIGVITIYSHGTEGINVAVLVSKIQNIRQNGESPPNSSMMIRVDNARVAIVYFGKNCMIACCPKTEEVGDSMLRLYRQMAPYAVRELDLLYPGRGPKKGYGSLSGIRNQNMYFAILRFADSQQMSAVSERDYYIYESNPYQKYCIILLPQSEKEPEDIYIRYSFLKEKYDPELMIFSRQCCSSNEFHREIERVKTLVYALLFLKGVYADEELSLLYMLMVVPAENDILLYSDSQLRIRGVSEEDKIFLHTLRLYLVLNSLKNVSLLLGIHVNSVKYRIEKALQYLDIGRDLTPSDISILKVLLHLELLLAELR